MQNKRQVSKGGTWPYVENGLRCGLGAADASHESILRTAVLDGIPIVEDTRNTCQGWPASRSLAASGGRPPQGFGARAPAPKAFGAGAGDEARTRDVLLGKEVLYH